MALGAHIKIAREARGLTLEALSAISGVDKGTISALENRDSSRSNYVEPIASAMGLTVEQLLLGVGLHVVQEPYTPWNAGAPTLHATTKVVPRLAWESAMYPGLPEKFELLAPDDSMAPRLRRDQAATFERDLQPQAGDGVLVRDSSGNFYIRVFRARRPDLWEAHALNDAYRPLTSDADGLTVLAVLVGVQARWS